MEDTMAQAVGIAFGVLVGLMYAIVDAIETPRGQIVWFKTLGFGLSTGFLAFFVWDVLTTSPPLIEISIRYSSLP